MRNIKRSLKVTKQANFEKILFLMWVTADTTFESNWNHELTLFFVMQIQHMIIEL